MSDNERKTNQIYKKVIILGIMASVAYYCIPELQRRVNVGVHYLINIWRRIK